MSIRRMALLAAALAQLGAGGSARAQSAGADADAAMAAYQARTRVVKPCRPYAADGAILVCARVKAAEAARYRLPLPEEARGDTPEAVMDERQRLTRAPAVPCGNGAILQKCGFVGVRYKRRL